MAMVLDESFSSTQTAALKTDSFFLYESRRGITAVIPERVIAGIVRFQAVVRGVITRQMLLNIISQVPSAVKTLPKACRRGLNGSLS